MFKPGTHPEVSFDMKFVKCFLKTSCCENIGKAFNSGMFIGDNPRQNIMIRAIR